MFLLAYNQMIQAKESVIKDIQFIKASLFDTTELETNIETSNEELIEMAKEFEMLVKVNTTTIQDQTIWKKKYAELEDKYKNKEGEHNSLIKEKDERKLKISRMEAFVKILKKSELQNEWDQSIINFTLEKEIANQ